MAIHVGHLGIVRLTGKDLEALRRKCYDRDGHCCVWHACGVYLEFERGFPHSMHMAHIRGRGAGGSDTLENVRSLCFHHHIECEHNAGGKPVPSKRSL